MLGLNFFQVFKYAALPEIMPRVRTLFFGGLGYIPFFIAVVYQMVGLLPRNHPYIMQKNIGRFGIRHVLAEAASNLTFSLKNIDQIVLYIAVLAGIIIFTIQLFAMASIFVLQPAMAFPTTWTGFFSVPAVNRPHDIAYMMLDMVFGVPHPSLTNGAGGTSLGFFESCIGSTVVCEDANASPITGTPTGAFSSFTGAMAQQMSPLTPLGYQNFPFPFHTGLHKIFGFYSTGLMIIAVMMISYFVVTVVGETTQTGTPFGKRFNKTWAPLRLVIAIGLLMPLTVGINSSQYIVLYAAKYGSAFATNGWNYFNSTLTTSYTGSTQRLVSMPNMPDINELTQFMFVARTCRYIADHYLLTEARAKAVEAKTVPPVTLPANERINPYVLLQGTSGINALLVTSSTSYQVVADSTPVNTVEIAIRFGVKDDVVNKESHSAVKPICGDIILPWIDGRAFADQEPYMRDIQEAYYLLVRDLWFGAVQDGIAGSEGLAYSVTPARYHRYMYYGQRYVKGLPETGGQDSLTGVHADHRAPVDAEYVRAINDKAIYGTGPNRIKATVEAALTTAQTSGLWGGPYNGTAANTDPLFRRGWAAAGIWYNRIAQVNGQLTAAAFGTPKIMAYPAIMESVSDKKAMFNQLLTQETRFNPEAPAIGDLGLLLDKATGLEFATALDEANKAWSKAANAQAQRPRGNPILGVISYILGLDGLYNMRDNTTNSTHPLAQLSGVGRSLVESSIRSLGYAAGAALFGGIMGPVPKQLMYVISSFFITTAMLGLTVGFVLFYVLPFLPFIYFFFAVGGWIKGIFEAMVGAPLWALAHIRIDGHGMPGNAAMNGYFLIFEVFLRPILIVFGMLASISIFAALVNVLNSIFDLVAENAAGYDMKSQIADATFSGEYMRSLIDQFFFTVIYTIIVYMIGMSAFKLIDMIPNNILRWMGQSVATFGDTREDPAQGLTSRASMGSQQVLGKLGGGLDGIAKATSGA
jgi:hypothetical protein